MAIELPKDASGTCIRLDTTTMYREDGRQFHVSDLFFEARPYKWFARNGSECIEVGKLYLTLPDSLKKLLEDLDRASNAKGFGCCAYVDRSERDCSSCIAANDRACTQPIMRDIAFRIRKLVGEDE